MNRIRRIAVSLLAASLLLVALACGKKGPVLPPLRFSPQKASDLTVRQQGQELTLEVAYPKTTTSGGALPGLQALEVWEVARTVMVAGKPQPLDPREFSQVSKRLLEITGSELVSATVGDRLQARVLLTQLAEPTPLASPSPGATSKPSASPAASVLPAPAASSAPGATATPTPSPSATPSPAPSPSPSVSPSPSPGVSPTPSPSVSPSPSPSVSPSPSPGVTPTPSPAASPAASPTPPPVAMPVHFFAVRTIAKGGDKSDFSNQAAISPTLNPPPPPTGVTLTPKEGGIEISWTAGSESILGHLIYRRDAQSRGYGPFLHGVRKEEGNSWLDTTARYGQRYVYTVSAAASLDPRIESALGGEHEIDYEDRFAPQPPQHLLALAEAGRVRLVWEPSASTDTVGYVVYRADPHQDFHRVTAQPVAGREFIDAGLVAGLKYRYRVAAIDGVGNLGQPGEEVEASPR